MSSIILDLAKGEVTTSFGDAHQRIVLITSNAFIRMMETLQLFGSAGFTIFHMMGREKGRYDVQEKILEYSQQNVTFTRSQLIDDVTHKLRGTGWGVHVVNEQNYSHKTATILVKNNPFFSSLDQKRVNDKRRSNIPMCHYFRGYWAGVFTDIWESEIECTETKCVAMGDSFCELKITSSQNGR